MALLLKVILDQPVIILGICFLVIGFAGLLFKVFNAAETGNRYERGIRSNNRKSKIQKKLLAFVLVAILIVLIVFIYMLRKYY